MKKILLFSICIINIIYVHSQTGNVGIGTNAPNSSAKLDIDVASDATKSGLLIPRVALTATNAASPITSPETSLLVYNTATAGTAPTNVTPGYYYNAGTTGAPNWVRLQTKADNDWTVANTTATPAIKTDNQYVTGKVGIGDYSGSNVLKNLHIKHSTNTDGILLQNTTGGAGSTTNIFFSTYADISAGTNRPGASIRAVDGGGFSADLILSTKTSGADANALADRLTIKSNGDVQVNGLAGTGNRLVFADATGVLNVNGKLRYTSIHDCYVGSYVSCSNCDKFVWFSKPGGYEADDNVDNPTSRKNMWMAPYSGRIVAIYLGVGPSTSNSGDEISKGRFIFRKGSTLNESGTPYYTNMINSGSSTYTVTANWQGGYFTTLAGSPDYTIASPNRGRFSLNENESLAWYDNNSSVFTFAKGEIIAIGVSGEYIEDNSYYMTIVWEYNVDDY